MFVVTFYSFKGGVGRTMALVNVAALLAERGMRVLVVDFDLEAPGISAYRQFAPANASPGIVDFVSNFMSTATAPRVEDHIVQCSLPGDEDRSIWIMPAGKRDDDYASKLGAIDWSHLYQDLKGYLFIEDLRQQWAAHSAAFDYVLIDSRTGHTDVGGICTRQLADLDVLMFVPNTQNIMGMHSVVSDIRMDGKSRGRELPILFCPSNVPDLDDENDILSGKLEFAKQMLGYDNPAAIIHHYNSLSLIDESIFVMDRPKSKLAGEYRRLLDKIAIVNIGDRAGALQYVRSLRDTLATDRGLRLDGEFVSQSVARLKKIGERYESDGELAWAAAPVYQLLGNLSEEYEALTKALENGVIGADVLLQRARNLTTQSRASEAWADLDKLFSLDDVPAVHLVAAIELRRTLGGDWLGVIEGAPALQNRTFGDISLIAEELMKDEKSQQLAFGMLKDAMSVLPETSDVELDNTLFLALIGAGRFKEAMEFYRSSDTKMLASEDVANVFNYTMARWGYTRKPYLPLFEHVLAIGMPDMGGTDANYVQCMALCTAVVGRTEQALSMLEMARLSMRGTKVFSCWSYADVDRKAMFEDLDEMASSFRGGEILPRFIRRHTAIMERDSVELDWRPN